MTKTSRKIAANAKSAKAAKLVQPVKSAQSISPAEPITKPSPVAKPKTVVQPSAAELERLRKENDQLKRDIKHLRRLTNSKRFQFATKVANAYNQLFPVDTKRRAAVGRLGQVYKKHTERKAERVLNRYAEQLAALASGYDRIIVLNSIPYDTKLKQRPHHFATEFAKLGYFVVYLETDNPVHPLRVISKNLVTINSPALLRRLAAPHRYFLSPNNMPTSFATLKEVKSWGFELIYDYLDEFHEDISGDLSVQLKVWDRLAELQPVLGLATAHRLQKYLDQHLGRTCPIVMAPNAVILSHFDYHRPAKATPDDLQKVLKLHRPIIGFYGALAPWIDFHLLNQVAAHHPEWSLVLIGINYNEAMADLEPADNIFYLGSKNYNQLSDYAAHFDCAIIPFRTGEIAKATSPIKLFEYMAAGLPTVCTKDLDECRGFDYVYMAADDADFETKLADAIADHKRPKARARLFAQAEDNTWAKRAATIDAALRDLESTQDKSA